MPATIPPVACNKRSSVISNNIFLVLSFSFTFKILISNSSAVFPLMTVRMVAFPSLMEDGTATLYCFLSGREEE